MAHKTWEEVKMRYCERAGCEVTLEAEKVYPAEHLPDQPPRVLIHRCSHALGCMQDDKPTCVWAGGSPAYDPFQE